MTLSQLALEDVEALYLGSSFPMADLMGPLLDQDEEEALSPSSSLEGEVPASPPLSFKTSLSPYQTLLSSPSSPPPSPTPTHPSSFLGTKAGVDSFPWLSASHLLDAHVGADDGKADDAFAGMDWMSEKIDLSDIDLDSLIGSCSSDESPGSPKHLLASLGSQVDLDLESFDAAIPVPHDGLDLELPSIPLPMEIPLPEEDEAEKAPDREVVTKSEPSSPGPFPSPHSPADPLDLGSEVDVPKVEKMATPLAAAAAIIANPSGSIQAASPILLSRPNSAYFVVVLTNKEEPPLVSLLDQTAETSPSSDCESDSGIESVADSPARTPSPPPTPPPSAGSSRTKPYSKPEPAASPSAKACRVKSVSGAPKVVEKKLKKMEQNKTAATRYRQKKRVEQELLSVEREELEKKNRELAEKAESISREIQYLKDLMEEVRKHHRGKTSSVA